ncbi:conserved hypothetical protein [Verticillium alfalfae VaMs.102]|uniref:Uncharacterized protein n=1 Tax=Verticillium alfalfae (strain VaMs.102 / ATCC MYA-4576 / FGSC 10136) TaxID=526221 RepID=C9SXH8_VERA1|nr:conserved hypothetical protein [Verticillium alfalfae VaMs.102]EEY23368.1 conserved hypothetical protein [Verticillium alfalfae VaMs.102]
MAPSHGQKMYETRLTAHEVDLGKDAPVTQESTGAVPSGSLANESAKKGGDFAENSGVQAGSTAGSKSSGTDANNGNSKSSNSNDASSGTKGSSGAGAGGNGDSKSSGAQGGTAPSYVENQYIRDGSGPHGKNLQEGIDYANTKDGLKAALEAEPGSANDPARAAEQQFLQSQTRAGRDAGPKEFEVGSKTTFDNLEEKQA